MKIFGYNIARDTPVISNEIIKKKPTSGKVGETITDQQVFRAKQDIRNWRLALDLAEQVITPNRIELVRIYKDVILDAHLSAVIMTRKINVLGKSFNIQNAEGELDEDSTAKFKTAWFRKFIDKSMDSLFWGTALIEFGDITDDGFSDVTQIPFENINPELQIVKKNIFSATDGAQYNKPPFVKWNVEVKEQEPFGLLNKCVPLIIWKKNAVGAWSIRADIFGMPLRIGKTDTRDPESRQKMIEMMSNMDVATWGVFDLEDDIELVETSGTAGHQIYKDLQSEMNSEISKLILGQTGTTDEKSFVGSAEVHERVSFEYTKADMTWFSNVVNDILIPKMIALEILPEGSHFMFDTKEVLSIEDQFEIDKELLKFFDIPEDVIEERYNTKVTKKAAPAGPALAPENVSIVNDVSKLYEGFFKDDKCCD